jgi:hypothetical protein
MTTIRLCEMPNSARRNRSPARSNAETTRWRRTFVSNTLKILSVPGAGVNAPTLRGLSQLDVPVVITTDERSGFPVISVGRRVTSDQVVVALDEE